MSHFFLVTLLASLLALLLDYYFGEPKRFHPLIGFGRLAQWVETMMNSDTQNNQKIYPFIMGALAWLLVVSPIVFGVFFIQQFIQNHLPLLMTLLSMAFFGYLAIGWKSLQEHGTAVADAFKNNDPEQARVKTSYLVSRDTTELNETELSRATIESVLENGNDAVFAALFWLILLGAPGVILYRLSNTLDAMWGYRNERFEYFGKFTAHMDDVLNYIPARLCALLYTLCGDTKTALIAWKTQAHNWYSPNAGVVMATGAGALGLRLGGAAIYHGSLKERPNLGSGKEAQAKDIKRSIRLLNNSVYSLVIIILIAIMMIIPFALPTGVAHDFSF